MLVRRKYKITPSYLAIMEIEMDNCVESKDKQYWKDTLKFLDGVKDLDEAQLSKPQKDWITNSYMKLKKAGYNV